MKVANLVFNPFVNDSRVLKESISLSNNGWHVEVIAHGDKNLPKEEKKENFKILRFVYFDRKVTTSTFKKIKIYLLWIKEVISYTKDFDIFHCNDLNTLPIGVISKLFLNKKAKIVYDAHEHEVYRAGYTKMMQRISKLVEGILIKYVDKVITVSESIAKDYEKIYNIEKPSLVLNTPFYQEINKKDIFRKKFNIPKENIIFIYQGGLSPKRGIIEFADIVKDMKNISYIIMGYGSLEEKIKEISQKNCNIYFHEAVPPEILLDYTSSADIGVCIEENICRSWDYALPNKMFEYLLAGLPIFVGGLSEMKNFVKKYDVGYIIEDLNSEIDVQNMIKKIKRDYVKKKNSVQSIAKQFNWQEQEKVLLKVYRDLK